MQIYDGDKVDVALSGSNTGTYTFTIMYVDRTVIYLRSDNNMGDCNGSTAIAKKWNWDVTLPNGNRYTSSDPGQEIAKIPTLAEMSRYVDYFNRSVKGWTSSYVYLPSVGNSQVMYNYCWYTQWSGNKPGCIFTNSGNGETLCLIHINL